MQKKSSNINHTNELQAKVLAEWELINTIARKRFGGAAIAEEAALAVMDGLEADDWQRVRKFTGKASFSSYIATLSVRLIEDFARQRFGRLRSPKWIQMLGSVWQLLYRSLCLERNSVADAVEISLQSFNSHKKREVESAAYEILERIPQCGKYQGLEIEYNEDEPTEMVESLNRTHPEPEMENKERKALFEVIFEIITGLDGHRLPPQLFSKVRRLKIALQPEERLLLRLCYQDRLPVTAAGKILGLTRHQANGRLRRLLNNLRSEFKRVGLEEELRLLLKDD